MPEGVAAAMAGAEGGGAYLVHAGKRSQVPRGGWMPLRWAQPPSYSEDSSRQLGETRISCGGRGYFFFYFLQISRAVGRYFGKFLRPGSYSICARRVAKRRNIYTRAKNQTVNLDGADAAHQPAQGGLSDCVPRGWSTVDD